jgi:hypothetical protein
MTELLSILNNYFDLSPNVLMTIFWILISWTLFWKGWSMWIAAKKNHKIWFIALLLLNSFGILDILYTFIFSKISRQDIKNLFQKIKGKVKKQSNKQNQTNTPNQSVSENDLPNQN